MMGLVDRFLSSHWSCTTKEQATPPSVSSKTPWLKLSSSHQLEQAPSIIDLDHKNDNMEKGTSVCSQAKLTNPSFKCSHSPRIGAQSVRFLMDLIGKLYLGRLNLLVQSEPTVYYCMGYCSYERFCSGLTRRHSRRCFSKTTDSN